MLFVFAWAAAAFEVVALGDLWPLGARPSLTLVLCAAIAIRAPLTDRPPDLRLLAWGLGLLRDVFTAGPLGAGALAYLGTASTILVLRRRMYVANPLVWLAVSGGLFFAGHVLEGLLAMILEGGFGATHLFGQALLASIGEAILLAPMVYAVKKLRLLPHGA